MHKRPNLAAIDMNLLTTLEALLAEKSVSKAAERLHLSQSATSHALNRLRDLLNDPILRREGRGMQTTPRAEALAVPLMRALNDIRNLLDGVDGFDPETTEREVVIATPDLFAPLLSPLIARLSTEAPKLRLSLVPPSVPDALTSGSVHLELVVLAKGVQKGIEYARLGTFSWAVFARADHPATSRLTAETWAEYPHIQVGAQNVSQGPVGRAAVVAGVDRLVRVKVPNFLAALSLVAQTDMLFTTLGPPFRTIAQELSLKTLPCPLDLPPAEVAVAVREAPDPAIQWLRDRVLEVCRS